MSTGGTLPALNRLASNAHQGRSSWANQFEILLLVLLIQCGLKLQTASFFISEKLKKRVTVEIVHVHGCCRSMSKQPVVSTIHRDNGDRLAGARRIGRLARPANRQFVKRISPTQSFIKFQSSFTAFPAGSIRIGTLIPRKYHQLGMAILGRLYRSRQWLEVFNNSMRHALLIAPKNGIQQLLFRFLIRVAYTLPFRMILHPQRKASFALLPFAIIDLAFHRSPC